MVVSGSRSTIAHFKRFGPLCYRLAVFMLNDTDLARRAVREVFLRIAEDTSRWPDWHTGIELIHHWCLEYRRTHAQAGGSGPASAPPPPTQTSGTGNSDESGEEPPIGPDTIGGAFAGVTHNLRDVLWSALAGATPESAWEPLADALERLEIAIRNEDIPGGGDLEWPT
jgi:hypothetical protein